MANAVTSQTLIDGDRNLVILLTGVLDTSNEARTIKVDVSSYAPAPTFVRVDRIQYSISNQLSVILDWDATTDVTFLTLADCGEIEARNFGGLTNNAGTGVTGDIYLTTVGWASGIQTYSVLLEMTKEKFA
jgi:hypothetical protein